MDYAAYLFVRLCEGPVVEPGKKKDQGVEEWAHGQ